MSLADLDDALLRTARGTLARVGSAAAAADPTGSVSPRSRALCAGLAGLARDCHRALGGHDPATLDAVADAAAMLSLLTKIDDQVIDALAFHGGPLADDRCEQALDRQTRAHLAPTLASIRSGRPTTSEPRCALAATLGQRLRQLAASEDRLAHVLDTIAFGWEVQVRAVRLLSSDPVCVDPAAIAAVSADISGAWLLMITMIGELPPDAVRPLGADEEAAFYRWGLHIQTADAFADLDQDTADGLVASRPGLALAAREPTLWREALASGERERLYAGLVAHDLDHALLPTSTELDSLADSLAGLGRVGAWLRWIHGFLTWRWLIHPACPREANARELDLLFPDRLGRAHGRAWAQGWASWPRAHADPSRPGLLAATETSAGQETRCSGR